MHRHARRDLAIAGMKGDALAVDVAHHQRDVLDRKRMPQHAKAHAAPGGVAHLAILQMKPRVRKAIEIAGMVVMQMGDDDVPDVVGTDAEARQRIDRIERQLAVAQLRLLRVEAGIDQNIAAAAPDQPDEIIEVRSRGLVRDRARGNSCGACAATSSHSGAHRFRRRFPSVLLFLGCAIGRPATASHRHPQRSNLTGLRQRMDVPVRGLTATA